jgi:hypothetical protein
MFDRLPIDCADQRNAKPSADIGSLASNLSGVNPFDDLDLQATYFEQYMLQDARRSSLATGIPKTLEGLQRFTADLRAANKTASHVRLVGTGLPADGVQTDEAQSARLNESFLTIPGKLSTVVAHTLCCPDPRPDETEELLFHHDSKLQSALISDLVWIEALTESAEDHARAASRLLRLVQQLRSDVTPTPTNTPVLIVSSMRRESQEVAPPFTSGLSESQIHVPLWIDYGAGHACRIQALTGSDDLLPTLTEYLTGTAAIPEEEESSVSVSENLTGQTVHLSGSPMSLVSVCEYHRPLPDRLLRLKGDSWCALRTQQYLLVRNGLSETRSDSARPAPGEEVQTARQLYLKPDDIWNVNDAIVSYAAIADQMEQMAAENEQAGQRASTIRRT